jgi:hypothetical protein
MIKKDPHDRPPAGIEPPATLVRPEPATRKFVHAGDDAMTATAAAMVRQQGMVYLGAEIKKWVNESGRHGVTLRVAYDKLKHKNTQVETELVEYLATRADATGQQRIHCVRDHRDVGVIGFRLSAKCLRRCGLSTVGEQMLKEIAAAEEAAVTK